MLRSLAFSQSNPQIEFRLSMDDDRSAKHRHWFSLHRRQTRSNAVPFCLPVTRPEWVLSFAEVCNFQNGISGQRGDSSFPITVSQAKLPRFGAMLGTRSVGLLEADIPGILKPDTR